LLSHAVAGVRANNKGSKTKTTVKIMQSLISH